MHLRILAPEITGCILAGGRGLRMGGVDKGLQPFLGQSLAAHALQRLAPQVGALLINANRHQGEYARLGAPFNARVCSDEEAGYPGPLAGFLSGLSHCRTPWLVCVPCDTPLFPRDLVVRLAQAALDDDADIALAHGWDDAQQGAADDACAQLRAQPVFCLLKSSLQASLREFVRGGGRKIDAWTARHRCANAIFERAGDRHAFANINTPAQLHALAQYARSPK